MTLEIEQVGSHDSGPCSCCNNMSRRVSGFLYEDGRPIAAYFVHWTLGNVRGHGAHFDLVLGEWGEGADPATRVAVTLEFRVVGSEHGFMVVDAADRLEGPPEMIGRALHRDEVVGTETAQAAFDAVDAVWVLDERIAEITRAKDSP